MVTLVLSCTLLNVARADVSSMASDAMPISSVASSSIVYSEKSGQLYTANLDAGSITRARLSNTEDKQEQLIDRKSVV